MAEAGGSSAPAAIEFSYDRARRRRTATFKGRINDAFLVSSYRTLVADPRYDAGADDLVDLRAVTQLDVTQAGLFSLMGMFAEIDRLGIPTKLAIIAPADHIYGVSRMYQLLRGDDVPEEVRVFRDEAAANEWLPKRGEHEPPKLDAV
jgi:hypothetical protein